MRKSMCVGRIRKFILIVNGKADQGFGTEELRGWKSIFVNKG
jgi:hypothetical protein